MTGWESLPVVPLNGENWSIAIAAKWLCCPEQDLRSLVQAAEHLRGESLAVGVIRMNEFSRSGRQPKAYPARLLVELYEKFSEVALRLEAGPIAGKAQEDAPERAA